jgi:tetratricopeptide (TPR) repeat protein
MFASVFHAFAQNEALAQEYFDKGEYEKAENLYQSLWEKQPNNFFLLDKLIQCQQSLQKYDEVEQMILKQLELMSQRNGDNPLEYLHVELGFNYEVRDQLEEAKVYYDKALNYVLSKPNNGYQIAKSFQDHQKLDYALQCYQAMMAAFPTANYYNQIAIIYGEKGDIQLMFETYLDMMSKQNADILNTQRFMGKFLTEDDQGDNNVLLRKILVKRIQTEPRNEWYKTLSWLYLQQKDYSKALIQEIALYKRYQVNLDGVVDVGKIAFDDHDYSTTQDAFNYVISQETDVDQKIEAHYYLLESQKNTSTDFQALDTSYQTFFKDFGKGSNTISIQTSYAQFLTFHQNQPQEAIDFLETALELNLDRFKKSEIKMQMADILVFTGQYNQALIAYTQVQNDLQNHPLAQTARYKVAQTSYFKGDFEWANTQLKVLKKGTTKLIANDAIDLSLLISDNIAQDSVQTALKNYAIADLLAYQNKTQQAIDTLSQVLIHHKGHPIEDEALFKQANLFEKTGKYLEAIQNYELILQLNQDDILIDDSLYELAIIYDEKLLDFEKAKIYYEKIVLEQPSSIYLVPARKRFRELRGDELMP